MSELVLKASNEESTSVRVKKGIKIGLIQALCIFFLILSIAPIWLLIVNATRSTVQIQSGLSIIPSTQLFKNYRTLADNGFTMFRSFFNSLFISVTGTGLAVYFSAFTAYGFFMYNFKLNKALFKVILLIIMLPGTVGTIGFYRLVLNLRLYDSYIPLIVPSIASPSTVFFLRQYMRSVYPKELTEAARIDGANEFRIFNGIAFRILLPALATMSIFGIVGSWNSYVLPLILLNSQSKFTMPMLVQLLRTNVYATDYGALYLGLLITILPLLILYFILSKYIIRGVAMGGIKE